MLMVFTVFSTSALSLLKVGSLPNVHTLLRLIAGLLQDLLRDLKRFL